MYMNQLTEFNYVICLSLSQRERIWLGFFQTRVHFTGYQYTDDISLQILSLTHEEIACTGYMLYAASFAENIYISPPELKATAHSVRNLLVKLILKKKQSMKKLIYIMNLFYIPTNFT